MLKIEELFEEAKNYITRKEFQEALGLSRKAELEFLAQGEYNINFLLEDQDNRYVFRLNTGSQMNLDNQIEYEFQALKSLESSGVTPAPLFLDDSCQYLPLGMLVMEYLPGRKFVYEKDLKSAAEVLARIHQLPVLKESPLITARNPLTEIWKECKELVSVYLESPLGKKEIKGFLHNLLEEMEAQMKIEDELLNLLPLSIVNTEVNSGNFIVNDPDDKCYLVDWEKPLITTPLQDLSHFKVPTTTLWKTDYRMNDKDSEIFIRTYISKRGLNPGIFNEINDALEIFDRFSLMRGISWSAMAWVEYQQPGRLLKNEDTFKKISMYLEMDFLKDIFMGHL